MGAGWLAVLWEELGRLVSVIPRKSDELATGPVRTAKIWGLNGLKEQYFSGKHRNSLKKAM